MDISNQLYTVLNSEQHSPVVISLPHSGTWLPVAMKKALLPNAVLANTDWFLPELYDFLPAAGLTTLINHVNRYVADPNRAVTYDPQHDYRSATVYQRNTFDHDLYAQPLTVPQIQARVRSYYRPYRQMLTTLLNQKKALFGHAYLIDLHSFAQYPYYPNVKPKMVVLGNDHDRTSSKRFRLALADQFMTYGWTVEDNFPFRGGDITRYYGHQQGVTAIQIELRYDQYIAHRSFGEEVLTTYQSEVFKQAQQKLQFLTAFLGGLQE